MQEFSCAQAPAEESRRCERFSKLYEKTIDQFKSAPHVIVGVGATGGVIARLLAQIGVETIALWDHDDVEEVNLGPQGFGWDDIGKLKVKVRADEILRMCDETVVAAYGTRFRKREEHPEGAYWWLCVDDLDARELIYKVAIEKNPIRIIDPRMGGMSYEIYNVLAKPEDEYLDTIQYARDNPVQEGCTTRTTPHCAMITASICIDFALKENPPWAVKGNLMDYQQEALW